jgi:predicted AlkP superfamily pyrophosphatase or phosphodiesterase
VDIRAPFLALLSALWLLPLAPAAGNESGSFPAPQQIQQPHLVLISVDGLRWDFPDIYAMPALDRMESLGLKAEAMQPAFPTVTFPNHYSIATGRLPGQHGLVANEFPSKDRERWFNYKDRTTVEDGSWYLAEPIWVTAEQAGLRTAAYYFVGTEADVNGIRPTEWHAFDAEVSGDHRVERVLDWLAMPAELRPNLITLYFEDVDDYSHWHGLDSKESLAAITRVDRQIGRLLDGIRDLPHGQQVFVLLVSDHGLASYRADREVFVLDQVVDLSGIRAVDSGPFVNLYLDRADPQRTAALRDRINGRWDCGRAVLPEDMPPAWQVTVSRRFADLFVLADPGCAVISTAARRHKVDLSDHGWNPAMPEMRGVFYALGPGILPGTRIGTVHVTEVQPLMLSILGLSAAEPHEAPGPLSWVTQRLIPTSHAARP